MKENRGTALMKEEIRRRAYALNADVCGFAEIGRFADSPEGFSPLDIYADCKTVIVVGMAVPKGLAKINPRLVYNHYNHLASHVMDQMLMQLAGELERQYAGCLAVPVPCDNPYEYWDKEQMEGRGLISMKHAAVHAGLGTLGKSTLLINREFGNMLILGVVLINEALPSDSLAEPLCIAGCTRCVDSCPAGAIQNGSVVQKLCREYSYGQKTARGFDTTSCNRCRTVCPLAFGVQK